MEKNTTSKKWTISNIPDLSGKVIIVTGANSGLGLESTKAYSSKNATVIMACRSVIKGEDVKRQIIMENPTSKIDVMELDLSDLTLVRKFAQNFIEKYNQLNILLNNAGIMMPPYEKTNDGFESQMGTNHLGHFALTGLLLPVIKKTPNARVINVSSMAHKSGKMDFENLLFENGKDYSPMKAYGRSKLANLLFTFQLQRFFEQNKINSIALAAHPGVSDTNLAHSLVNKYLYKILRPLFRFMIQPAIMGALPQLRASVDSKAIGGQYYGPDGNREMKGFPVLVEPNNAAKNKVDALKLWEISEKLTEVVFE